MANPPQTNTLAHLTFSITSPLNPLRFTPRLGKVKLSRPEPSSVIDIETPNFIVSTSRGVVPHLSRDHVQRSKPIRWLHVPFESFLDHVPPIPTLQPGEQPLHSFLGYHPSQHIVSMSLRDPADNREMPPNGNDHIAAHCVRGVRKVTRVAWQSYVQDCKPDIIVAPSDIPFTALPHSQKRLTKSIQRSVTWLMDMFRPIPGTEAHLHPNVLVHMAGGSSEAARTAFAASLTETLHDKEAADCKPHRCLDDGLAGYVFDLTTLRSALLFDDHATINGPFALKLLPLMIASLNPVSSDNLRLVNSANSPHEMLIFILRIGIDLFDSRWAQEAADRGIALDFRFPVPDRHATTRGDDRSLPPKKRAGGKIDLGHNLYDPIYAQDFFRLAYNFLGSYSDSARDDTRAGQPICDCAACSPVAPSTYISHSSLDDEARESSTLDVVRPFTRAYLHHLLQTHEMSAHTLLTMHNLQVLDAFFTGVRSLLASPEGISQFPSEVEKFLDFYDEGSFLLEEAMTAWKVADIARGKGRLAREKAQAIESNLIPDAGIQ